MTACFGDPADPVASILMLIVGVVSCCNFLLLLRLWWRARKQRQALIARIESLGSLRRR